MEFHTPKLLTIPIPGQPAYGGVELALEEVCPDCKGHGGDPKKPGFSCGKCRGCGTVPTGIGAAIVRLVAKYGIH